MGFLKKLFGHLGLFKDDAHRDDGAADDAHSGGAHDAHEDTLVDQDRKEKGKGKDRGPGKSSSETGFVSSKPKFSVAPTHRFISPVVSECLPGSGGIQGLQWYAEKFVMDEEGDVAHEFLSEVIAVPSASGRHNVQVERGASIRAVKLRSPLCIVNGNVYVYSNRHYS